MKTEELIKELRRYVQSWDAYRMGPEFADTITDAADTIERMERQVMGYTKEAASAKREKERLQAERDKAVNALTGVVNEYRRETSGTDFCGLCEYDMPPAGENGQMAECPGFYRDDCFKWRGLEGRIPHE